MAVEMKGATTVPPAPGSLTGRTASALVSRLRKATSPDFCLDVTVSAPPGITILFGASGAGKTTLLHCIAGLVDPDAGRIVLGEKVFFDSEQGINVSTAKRRIGYVVQTLALFPHLTVEQNVQYGLLSRTAAERKHQSGEILESFRIGHLATRRPSEVSGGERQRVALARSLVTDPCVLLLDEPMAALDAGTKSKIIGDLRAWNERHGIPILYVTHSREEVFALGERVIVLDRGRVLAEGTPHEVIRAPRHQTVAQLAGFENIFNAQVTAVHEDRGTLTCRIEHSFVELETPLIQAEVGTHLRVAISAGDILLASTQPLGLSARNIIPGKITSLERRDVIILATVNCGIEMQVQLTLAARDSLHLQAGSNVWLIVKTHSCHLLAS